MALGLLAGLLFAASASLQQHAARGTAVATNATGDLTGKSALRPLIALLKRLVRNPLWLAGWCTNLIGFLVQAAALHLGSVALVQPLLVTQLLFAMPLSTAWARRWPTFTEWFGAVAIGAGVAVFLLIREVAPVGGEADRGRVILAGLCAAALVALLVVASAGRSPLMHAALVSVAAGVCFAVSAVLMKLTADDLLHRGVPATALDWPGYTLAISTLTGLLLEQSAFATGSLSAAVAAMTITNPIASYLLGVLVFRVALPTGPGALAALSGSAVLLIVGVAVLSRTPTVRTTEGQESEPRTPTERNAAEETEPSSTPDRG